MLGSERQAASGGAVYGKGLALNDWSDVSLPRPGQSPLRFNGLRLSHHRHRFSAQIDLEVSLWRRRLTGWVIAYPISTGAEIASDAVLVDSLDEAMRYLEDLCAFLPLQTPCPPETPVEKLLQLQQWAQFHHAFSSLVGEALANWSEVDEDAEIGLSLEGSDS